MKYIANVIIMAILSFALFFQTGAHAASKGKITVKRTNCKEAQQKYREKVKAKCAKKKNPGKCQTRNKSQIDKFYTNCLACNKTLPKKADAVKNKCSAQKNAEMRKKCLAEGRNEIKASHKRCLKKGFKPKSGK